MRTKRIIPLLLVALAASCGRETVETPASSGDASTTLMGFTTLAGDASTRGTELDLAGLKGTVETPGPGFEVWTYAGSDIYVSGDVTWNGTAWNYGNSRYWPYAAVTSYAIAPAGAVAAAGGTITENVPNDQNELTALAAPTVSYTLPPPGPDQKDLMFAKATSYGLNEMPTGGAIPVVFSHALAQISFKAYKAAAKDGSTFGESAVTVTSITLTGLKDSGTAPVQAPAVWGSLGGNATYDFSFTREGEDAGTTVAGAIVASSNATAPTELDAKVTDGTTTTDAGAIFMMPQPLTSQGGGDVTVTMTVNYSVNNTPENPVIVPLTGTWAAGGVYAITLAISPSGVDVPSFTATFTGDVANITIGSNKITAGTNANYTIAVAPNTISLTELAELEWPAGYYYVEAWGGNGGSGVVGNNYYGGYGGQGGTQKGLYKFNKGDVITVVVGGKGGDLPNGDLGSQGAGGASAIGAGGAGGNGGDRTDNNNNQGAPGAGGGGASGIMVGSTVYLAAGGGGGGGGLIYSVSGQNGNRTQAQATAASGGDGGVNVTAETTSTSAGGTGGTPDEATVPTGGGGGGGGGGYQYGGDGGGAGDNGGQTTGGGLYPGMGGYTDGTNGGGGSGGQNYVDVAKTANNDKSYTLPTNTRPDNRTDGYVVITYLGK